MNEWLAHTRFPFGLCQTQRGYCWRMSTGRPFTVVNEYCVGMLGVLSILPWSTLASCFLLQEEMPCLSECLGLHRRLVRKVGKLKCLSQEQTSTNEGWELMNKYLSFSPAVGQLWASFTAVFQRSPNEIEPHLYCSITHSSQAFLHFCLTCPTLTIVFEITS